MTLKELEIGKTASILSVGGEGALRQSLSSSNSAPSHGSPPF